MNKILSFVCRQADFKKIVSIGFFVAFLAVFFIANAATTVTLKVEKNGKGAVTSDDGKINCGTDCKEVYYSVGSMTLYATPANGFTFEKWTGNACVAFGTGKGTEGTTVEFAGGSCLVSLDYNKTLTAVAHFKKISGSSSSKSSSSKSKSSSKSTVEIKVISPNGGEVWKAGTKKNIKFKGNLTNEVVYLNLEWSGKDGANVFIGESVALGNGKTSTYSWTIPSTTEQRNDYKISARYPKVAPTDNEPAVKSVVDSSDKTFTIKNASMSSSSKSSSSKSSKSSSSSKSSATTTPSNV